MWGVFRCTAPTQPQCTFDAMALEAVQGGGIVRTRRAFVRIVLLPWERGLLIFALRGAGHSRRYINVTSMISLLFSTIESSNQHNLP
jgi:hypothetical protein